ncbi:MAG: hypothetical protein Kow0090_00410 [Myxococcota bacterium]
MKIYARLIPIVSKEIVEELRKEEDVEIADAKLSEAALDVGAVMRQYVEDERKLNDEAKEEIFKRNLDYKNFKKIKEAVAEKKNFPLGDEGIDFVLDQIIEALMISGNVEEVYSEDNILRKKMLAIMKKHFDLDEQLDAEVRGRIRNLQEGTLQWDIEYEKQLTELKRRKGLI